MTRIHWSAHGVVVDWEGRLRGRVATGLSRRPALNAWSPFGPDLRWRVGPAHDGEGFDGSQTVFAVGRGGWREVRYRAGAGVESAPERGTAAGHCHSWRVRALRHAELQPAHWARDSESG